MGRPAGNVSGVFGKLTVSSRAGSNKDGNAMWLCVCECGKQVVVLGKNLRKGTTASCGCVSKAKIGEYAIRQAAKRIGLSVEQYKAEGSHKLLENEYIICARDRGIPYYLNSEQFRTITQQNCFYCGEPPSPRKKDKSMIVPYICNGIDRFDNSKGYEYDNCVPCCTQCNYAKGTMSGIEFYEWIGKIVKYQVDKKSQP